MNTPLCPTFSCIHTVVDDLWWVAELPTAPRTDRPEKSSVVRYTETLSTSRTLQKWPGPTRQELVVETPYWQDVYIVNKVIKIPGMESTLFSPGCVPCSSSDVDFFLGFFNAVLGAGWSRATEGFPSATIIWSLLEQDLCGALDVLEHRLPGNYWSLS